MVAAGGLFKLAQPELQEHLQAASGLTPVCFAFERISSSTYSPEEYCLTGNLKINERIQSKRIFPESMHFQCVILLFQG